MKFFLGAHHPDWLARVDVPLFVSRRSLARRRSLPRARATWALDSGGFSELSLHGAWTLTPSAYVAEVRRYRDEIGGLAWAAPQDWMCEAAILSRTGLTIAEHQRRTVNNLLDLRSLAPELPFVPVLQGWTMGDYFEHVDAYERAGVNLVLEQLVGLGTVCRRQATTRAAALVAVLAAEKISLHGFGFKRSGLREAAMHLASADSLAWSFNARRNPPLEGCSHRSCANCLTYALEWRAETLAQLDSRRAA